eukprot:170610_1
MAASPGDGCIFVVDGGNAAVRKIEVADGHVTTLALKGEALQRFVPANVCIGTGDFAGTLFISGTHRVVRYDIQRRDAVTHCGGFIKGFANGPPAAARFNYPDHMVCLPSGDLLISDYANNCIRCCSIARDEVYTLAGSRERVSRDGPGHSAGFNRVVAMCFLARSMEIFAVDGDQNLRVIELEDNKRKAEIVPGICEFSVTGTVESQNQLFVCSSCEGGVLVCTECSKSCHDGHNIEPVGSTTSGHCNCPGKSNCQLCPPDIRLVAAILLGSPADVQKALESGAKPERAVKLGADAAEFALIRCAARNDYGARMAQLLTNAKADVNARNKVGRTALIAASRENNIDLVKTLVQMYATLDVQDERGRTAVFFAAQNDYPDTLKILIRAGADVNLCALKNCSPVYMAASKNSILCVKELIKNGADYNTKFQGQFTPLATAQYQGFGAIVNLINQAESSGHLSVNLSTLKYSGQISTQHRDTGADALSVDSLGTIYLFSNRNRELRTIYEGQGGRDDYVSVTGVPSGTINNFVVVDKMVFLTDREKHRIFKMSLADGVLKNFCGKDPGLQDGYGQDALFNMPGAICAAGDGTLFVVDSVNRCIRKVEADGRVGTLCTFQSTPRFQPQNVCLGRDDHEGWIFVSGTHKILKINLKSRSQLLFAGKDLKGYRDGKFDECRFDNPDAIVCGKGGTLFVADYINCLVRCLSAQLQETYVLIGNRTRKCVDGSGSQACLRRVLSMYTNPECERLLLLNEDGDVRQIDLSSQSIKIGEPSPNQKVAGKFFDGEAPPPSRLDVNQEIVPPPPVPFTGRSPFGTVNTRMADSLDELSKSDTDGLSQPSVTDSRSPNIDPPPPASNFSRLRVDDDTIRSASRFGAQLDLTGSLKSAGPGGNVPPRLPVFQQKTAPPRGAPPLGAPPLGAPHLGAPPLGAPPRGAPPPPGRGDRQSPGPPRLAINTGPREKRTGPVPKMQTALRGGILLPGFSKVSPKRNQTTTDRVQAASVSQSNSSDQQYSGPPPPDQSYTGLPSSGQRFYSNQQKSSFESGKFDREDGFESPEGIKSELRNLLGPTMADSMIAKVESNPRAALSDESPALRRLAKAIVQQMSGRA